MSTTTSQTEWRATAVAGTYPIHGRYELEGQPVLEIYCGRPLDFEQYHALPVTLACGGQLYYRSAWDSDTGIVVYKAGLFATPTDRMHAASFTMYWFLRNLIEAFPWGEDEEINGGDVVDFLPIDEIKTLLREIDF